MEWNGPTSRKHDSLPFLTATTLSRFRTLVGRFEQIHCPSMALYLDLYITSGATELQGQGVDSLEHSQEQLDLPIDWRCCLILGACTLVCLTIVLGEFYDEGGSVSIRSVVDVVVIAIRFKALIGQVWCLKVNRLSDRAGFDRSGRVEEPVVYHHAGKSNGFTINSTAHTDYIVLPKNLKLESIY